MYNNIDNQKTWDPDQDKRQRDFIPSSSGVDSISEDDFEYIKNKSRKSDLDGVVSRSLIKTWEDLFEIKKEFKELDTRLKRYKKDLGKTDRLIVGVMIFSVVSFLGIISTLWYDAITDKKLYDQKYSLYKEYSENNFKLLKKIEYQNMKISNLENQIKQLNKK